MYGSRKRNLNSLFKIAAVISRLRECTFGDISAETGLSSPILSKFLDEMKTKQLILWRRSTEDGRKWIYWLNPNELVVITVDEAVKAVNEELEKVGEGFEDYEKRALRVFLIRETRKRILEYVERGEGEKTKDAVLRMVLQEISMMSFVRLLSDGSDFDELYVPGVSRRLLEFFVDYVRYLTKSKKRRSEELGEVLSFAETVSVMPTTLAEKWSKTEEFESYLNEVLPPLLIHLAIGIYALKNRKFPNYQKFGGEMVNLGNSTQIDDELPYNITGSEYDNARKMIMKNGENRCKGNYSNSSQFGCEG